MTLPSVEAARGWSGLTAVDRDDQPIGKISGVYLDHDTGMPEWALVATPQRRRAFVPLAGAARRGDRVAVTVPRAAVGDAPAVRPGRELSDRDAARLYGHYLGASGERKGGARRARGRGRLARLGAAAAPPARPAVARLRGARGRVPQAGRSSGAAWRTKAEGAITAIVKLMAGRWKPHRRRAGPPTSRAKLRLNEASEGQGNGFERATGWSVGLTSPVVRAGNSRGTQWCGLLAS